MEESDLDFLIWCCWRHERKSLQDKLLAIKYVLIQKPNVDVAIFPQLQFDHYGELHA